MSLRVIAGSAKGRRLKPVPGDSTRPIMDRVKEALFSILGRSVQDAAFLDLFAGTGSVGIEALSRGARQAVFVEKDSYAVKTIRDNLETTKLAEKAIIRRTDVFVMLRANPPAQPYDFIYIAPPQYKGFWLEALNVIDQNMGWVAPHTSVIVQIDPKEFKEMALENLAIVDERRYGKTLLLFLERKMEDVESDE